MHKINTETSVDGEFVPGNPSTGQQATKLNAEWFNSVQRELVNTVLEAGMALSETDDEQLKRSVAIIAVKAMTSGLIDGSISLNGKIKVSGNGYTIELDGTTGEISIVESGGVGFTLKSNGNCANITDSLKVDGSLVADEQVVCGGKVKAMDDITKSVSSGVEISADEGIKFKNSDGTDAMTQIGYSSVDTGAVTGSSGTFSAWLNVLAGKFKVTSSEVRSKLKTIVQNDVGITGDVEIQSGNLKVSGAVAAAQFTSNRVVTSFVETDRLIAPFGSTGDIENPRKGDMVFCPNTYGSPRKARLYVYSGSEWMLVSDVTE